MNCKIVLIVFIMLPAAGAEDSIFHDVKLSRLDSNQEPKVDLTLSDTGFTVRTSTASPLEIPYSSVQKITYEFSRHRRIASGVFLAGVSPLAGISVMHSKTRSHWLMFDYQENGASKNLVLRLDKSDYKKVLEVLEAKSGRHPESPASKTSDLDPSEGSKDIDSVLPVSLEKTAAALKPAMEMYGCKVRKDQPALIECRRDLRNSERTGGGGEVVTAILDAQGQQTHVRIKTNVSAIRKRNWSTPIYNQLAASLGLTP